MDAQVQGTGQPSSAPIIDLYVPPAATGSHIVPILSGSAETAQQAQVLCETFLNSIPQVPGAGNDWVGFLSENVPFGQLDAQIRATLADGGHSDFYPNYDIQNDALIVTPTQQEVP